MSAHRLRRRAPAAEVLPARSLTAERGSVIAVGWTGSAFAGKRAVLHHIDVGGVPRLVGSAAFGGDWTWSPAYDDTHALSFDPRSTMASLPMTTLRGGGGPISAVQVFALGPHGPRPWIEKEAIADRLLFIGDKLLAFGAEGVTVIPLGGEGR